MAEPELPPEVAATLNRLIDAYREAVALLLKGGKTGRSGTPAARAALYRFVAEQRGPVLPSEEAWQAALEAAPIYTSADVEHASSATARSVIESPNPLEFQIRLAIREWLTADNGLTPMLRAAYRVQFGPAGPQREP